jgi:hypothetical protein
MLQLILTQPQPAQLVLGVRRLSTQRMIGEANYDIGHLSGLPVEVEMLDASAACVSPTINIPLGKEVLTLRLQMGFHKAILLILILLCMK